MHTLHPINTLLADNEADNDIITFKRSLIKRCVGSFKMYEPTNYTAVFLPGAFTVSSLRISIRGAFHFKISNCRAVYLAGYL